MIVGGHKSPVVTKTRFECAVVVYKSCQFPDNYAEALKFQVFFKILQAVRASK